MATNPRLPVHPHPRIAWKPQPLCCYRPSLPGADRRCGRQLAFWVGLRFLSSAVHVNVDQGGGGKKQVSIKTPLGSLEVNPDVNEASLGLPIYPGATPLKDHDSATVNLDIADKAKLRVLAGKFETSGFFG